MSSPSARLPTTCLPAVPPTNNPLDLSALLREGNGLHLSSAINGVGAWLDGDPIVIKRLGHGGSADALLVRRQDTDEEFVLKVAIEPDNAHGRLWMSAAWITHRTRSFPFGISGGST